jgi:hypothetical protein
MPDNVSIFDLSSDLMAAPTSSFDLSGSMNIRRKVQRRLYSRLLRGEALRADVGEAPDQWISGSLTASFPQQLATPPSWTRFQIGRKDGFVIPPFSSSDHEVSRLNTFSSGSLALEMTAVPASASSYYSKQSRFLKLTYKLSASANLPTASVSQSNPYTYGPNADPNGSSGVPGRTFFTATSGSYFDTSIDFPAFFDFDVAEYGKIRDIRVWVEFIHDVRVSSGTSGIGASPTLCGLGAISLALRSPNVNFYSAHPFWNSMEAKGFAPYSGHNVAIPELLRSSYLLWQGRTVTSDFSIGYSFSGGVPVIGFISQSDSFDPFYATWDSDMDMRTVFCDNSVVPNPHHLDRLYASADELGPGKSTGSLLGSATNNISALSASAPNAVMYAIEGYPIPSFSDNFAGSLTNHHTSVAGNFVPWFYDNRVKPGFITGTTNFTASLGLSPPPGWLSGPGGSANVNEFPTTGSQLGPVTIKPVYPLLEDVYSRKVFDYLDPSLTPNPFPSLLSSNNTIGFRPGLRGTEVHGKWRLMMSSNAGSVNFGKGIWFRQARLEFVIDTGRGTDSFYPSKGRRFSKGGSVSQRPGFRRVSIISGTANFDIGINYVYVKEKEEYGRSVGITDDPGRASDSFAVFSQITGSLSSSLSGSRSFFLKNEFGTPYIPLSSGSGVSPSFSPFDDDEISNSRNFLDFVLRRSQNGSPAQDLRSTLNRSQYFKTSIDRASDLLDSFDVITSGSS